PTAASKYKDKPPKIACKMNAIAIATISNGLNEATENPSTKFLVNNGTASPVSVVITLANKPKNNEYFGIFVESMSKKNCLRLLCFSSIYMTSSTYFLCHNRITR